MNIKAIETIYNGYKFRSRLEARWAVFFNALGIEYRYEPEGFDLDGIRYLPDFYLPKLDYWIEVKADVPTNDERDKVARLAIASKKTVLILSGDVWQTSQCFHYHATNKTPEQINSHFSRFNDSTIYWITTTECIISDDVPASLTGYDLIAGYVWSTGNWYECGYCGMVSTLGACFTSCSCDPPDFQFTSQRLIQAFTKARQARFERGEE